MIDLETTFEKLLGRQPSETEIQNLYRVKNALGIRDNDALWLILMALESYDSLYKKYPEMISSQISSIVEEQKKLLANLAEVETKKVLSSLVEAVNENSSKIALEIAETSKLRSWGWTMLAFLVSASLCIFIGFVLGSGKIPFWSLHSNTDNIIQIIITSLVNTPIGYVAPIFGGILGGLSLSKSMKFSEQAIKNKHFTSSVLLIIFSILPLLSFI